MQDEKTTEPKPFSALKEALFYLDYANDSVLEAERDLAKAKQAFTDKLRALGPVWIQASNEKNCQTRSVKAGCSSGSTRKV